MAKLETLIDLYRALGEVEREMLVDIATRLEMGQRLYGEFNYSKDKRRNFRQETCEELEDGIVYLTRALGLLMKPRLN